MSCKKPVGGGSIEQEERFSTSGRFLAPCETRRLPACQNRGNTTGQQPSSSLHKKVAIRHKAKGARCNPPALGTHWLVLSQFGPGHHMKLRSPFLCLESGPAHGWENFTALEPPEVRSPRPLPSTLLREDSGFCSGTISRPQWTFQPSWLILHRH